jgi:hypothetical protein
MHVRVVDLNCSAEEPGGLVTHSEVHDDVNESC